MMSEVGHSDTQSIDRALALLSFIGGAGAEGARFSDLVATSGLPKPTARRILLALTRAGMVEQNGETRRYQVGPELYVLGTLASVRFGIHALARGALVRISASSEDTSFLSVPRDTFSVCLHREEGDFPIRTHALKIGDRHPLGCGAGSLAILAAHPDDEIERVLERNAGVIAKGYPNYSTTVLRDLITETRHRGYALNPGMILTGSWGIGVPVFGPDGQVAGALSIAAIESRLNEQRQRELVPLLREEAMKLEDALRKPKAVRRPGLRDESGKGSAPNLRVIAGSGASR
jgi:DNA-binding IclR family transcriptional regulator